jgi:hypothetical protein
LIHQKGWRGQWEEGHRWCLSRSPWERGVRGVPEEGAYPDLLGAGAGGKRGELQGNTGEGDTKALTEVITHVEVRMAGEIGNVGRGCEFPRSCTAGDVSHAGGGAHDALDRELEGLGRGGERNVVFINELAGDEGDRGACVTKGISAVVVDGERAAWAVVILGDGFSGTGFNDLLIFFGGLSAGDSFKGLSEEVSFSGGELSSSSRGDSTARRGRGAPRCARGSSRGNRRGCIGRGVGRDRGLGRRGVVGGVGRAGEGWGGVGLRPRDRETFQEGMGDTGAFAALGVHVPQATAEGAGGIAGGGGAGVAAGSLARGGTRMGHRVDHIRDGALAGLTGKASGGDRVGGGLGVTPQLDVEVEILR